MQSCSKIIHGDAVEEQQLGLEPIKVDIPKVILTESEVFIEHNVLSQVATAAGALRLSIVEDCAMTGLALLNTLSQAKFKKPLKPLTVDPQDYVQPIQGILLEIDNCVVKMKISDDGKAMVRTKPSKSVIVRNPAALVYILQPTKLMVAMLVVQRSMFQLPKLQKTRIKVAMSHSTWKMDSLLTVTYNFDATDVRLQSEVKFK